MAMMARHSEPPCLATESKAEARSTSRWVVFAQRLRTVLGSAWDIGRYLWNAEALSVPLKRRIAIPGATNGVRSTAAHLVKRQQQR